MKLGTEKYIHLKWLFLPQWASNGECSRVTWCFTVFYKCFIMFYYWFTMFYAFHDVLQCLVGHTMIGIASLLTSFFNLLCYGFFACCATPLGQLHTKSFFLPFQLVGMNMLTGCTRNLGHSHMFYLIEQWTDSCLNKNILL